MRNSLLCLASALMLFGGAGCKQSSTESRSTASYVPPMPHGGTPVQVGDHDYHLELVTDTHVGTMTAYVLDDHAENPRVVAPTTFELIATLNEGEQRLSFQPVTNAPGVIGSAFAASADWLKTATNFQAVIPSITLGGKSFDNIKFPYPEGTRHVH